MSELRRFIEQRRQELMHQLNRIRSELEELDRAESVLVHTPIHDENQEELQLQSDLDIDPEELTIQQMALYCLAIRPAVGGSANQILGYIHEDFGKQLERTSLSPQLSRLRKAGKVIFNDGDYFITQAGDQYIRKVMDSGGQ